MKLFNALRYLLSTIGVLMVIHSIASFDGWMMFIGILIGICIASLSMLVYGIAKDALHDGRKFYEVMIDADYAYVSIAELEAACAQGHTHVRYMRESGSFITMNIHDAIRLEVRKMNDKLRPA